MDRAPRALGQALPVGADQQVVMGELRRGRRAQRPEQLDLHRRVGDMVLAADDVGDARVEIVHDRGQGIKIGAVLAHQNRIGQRGAIDMAVAADQIVPAHDFGLQPEAPVRLAARRLQRRAFGFGQAQGRAIVNRRRAARDLQAALALQLVRRLVAGIEPPGLLQPFRGGLIEREPLRLAELAVRRDAQPFEIDLDAQRIFLGGSFGIGVVESQDELAAMLAGEKIVQQRRARIADMDAAGGRRRESHHGRDEDRRFMSEVNHGGRFIASAAFWEIGAFRPFLAARSLRIAPLVGPVIER